MFIENLCGDINDVRNQTMSWSLDFIVQFVYYMLWFKENEGYLHHDVWSKMMRFPYTPLVSMQVFSLLELIITTNT